MPQVHFVKKARKSCKALGIKKGKPYYWWKFRHGGKQVSLTPPPPSELTQSAFWSSVFSLQENYSDVPDFEDIESNVESITSELEDIKSDCDEKLSNMPESLQQGPTGEMLQGRIDALDDAINNLQSIDISPSDESEADTKVGDELPNEKRAVEIWDEVMGVLSDISCD